MLSDVDIATAITDGRLSITGPNGAWGPAYRHNYGPGAATEDAIQSASVDLTVGEILQPARDGTLEGTARTAQLGPGETAVIRTAELLTLADDIAGLSVPMSRLARDAVLLTNPGHVDPGYTGNLTFTVINMGAKDYAMRPGDALATLLFYRLDTPAHRDWLGHNPNPPAPLAAGSPSALAPDFAGISEKTRALASVAVRENAHSQGWYFGLVALAITVGGAIAAAAVSAIVGQVAGIDRLEQRVQELETRTVPQPAVTPAPTPEAGVDEPRRPTDVRPTS